MSGSPRHALRVVALVFVLGVPGQSIAWADDGTGAPAPGPSPGLAADEDETSGIPPAGSAPSTTLGNGRLPIDSSGSKGGSGSPSSPMNPDRFGGTGQPISGIGAIPSGMASLEASQADAKLEAADAMTALLDIRERDADVIAELQDLMAQIRTQISDTAVNGPTAGMERYVE
jgi:hypothetical protein